MFWAAAALLMNAQAPATAAPPPDGDIVVTGRRELDAAAARRHINAITQTREGQLVRFHMPVCPRVIGMGQREARVVVARIREIAAQAGIAAAGANCRTNIALIVTPSGRRLVAELRRVRPSIFREVAPREMRRLLDEEESVRVWTTTEILNEDGLTVNPQTGLLQVRAASIITVPTRQATLQSVVVIDDAAADGKSLGQLADYVAMRSFTGAHPPQIPAGGDTILTLFEPGGPAPAALTGLDAAYLSAFYRSGANQRSMQQMSQISRMVASDVAAQPVSAE